MQLRPHQIEVIEKTRQSIVDGYKKPLIFAPCSFGKTIVSAEIAKLCVEKGNKILFLVHRRLLAIQTKEKFDEYGLNSSIMMAGMHTNFNVNIMITTIQTYSRRLTLDEPRYNQFFHDADIIFCDEAHLGISETYQKIYSYYKDKIIIGLSGSPARGDQRGLGEVFSNIIKSTGIEDLTKKGFLAPIRYFAAETPDLTGVKTTAGDYNKGELQKKMNKEKLVGDVIENWLRLSKNRPTIIFSTGVKHSINLSEQFIKNGIPSAHLDSRTPHIERMDVLNDFREGRITVVTNCQLFTEGYDADFVSCIGIARPTKSLPLWIQMAGRGQRIYQGKKDCILLDFGGNIERHGLIEWEREWSLDGKKRAWAKPSEKQTKKVVKCRACNLVFEGKNKCPDCDTEVKSFGKKIATIEAELKELDKKKPKEHTIAEKRIWYGMLKFQQIKKGYADGWVSHKFKEKMGVWPKGFIGVEPIEPSKEFLNYMKFLNIKWAKRNQNKELNGSANA